MGSNIDGNLFSDGGNCAVASVGGPLVVDYGWSDLVENIGWLSWDVAGEGNIEGGEYLLALKEWVVLNRVNMLTPDGLGEWGLKILVEDLCGILFC